LEVIMKVRTSIVAVIAAAMLCVTGTVALALPAAASPSGGTHTLKFIAVTTNTVVFSKTNTGRQDTDVNSKGKTVGFDSLNIVVNPKTGKGTILESINASGGFMIAALPLYKRKTLSGIVTGGVGTFKGAFGSIVTTALNKAGTRTMVTITYHT
jgi:hypothetical protein